jgi:hypothetical protein
MSKRYRVRNLDGEATRTVSDLSNLRRLSFLEAVEGWDHIQIPGRGWVSLYDLVVKR